GGRYAGRALLGVGGGRARRAGGPPVRRRSVIEPVHTDSSERATPEYRRVPAGVWLALFGLLAIWVAHRAGAFDLWTTVRLADGSEVRLPNVYGTVDHPFHATRAELLRRALGGGQPLRWVGEHQGGIPA